jgi:hypothetical protein
MALVPSNEATQRNVIEIFQRRGSTEKIGCPNFARGGSDSEPFRMRPRGVCAHRIWARPMSTFEDNLIERLWTRLVDVQPQNQLGEGSIALAENLTDFTASHTRVSNLRYFPLDNLKWCEV